MYMGGLGEERRYPHTVSPQLKVAAVAATVFNSVLLGWQVKDLAIDPLLFFALTRILNTIPLPFLACDI